MGNGKRRRSGGLAVGQIFFILLLLGLCEWLVKTERVGTLFLSAPTQVLKEAAAYLSSASFYTDLFVTLYEFVVGYSLAVAAGIGVGLAMVLVPGAERFFRPFLSGMMAVPKVTIIPLMMLWLGIGPIHKIAIVFLFCFFTMAFNTITGVKQTMDNHLKVARVFEASHAQLITKVILPSAMPSIFAGLRISAASGLIGALYGEMISSKSGLGNVLVQATSLYNTAQAFAVIMIVTAVSVGIIWAIDTLEKKVFLKWKSFH